MGLFISVFYDYPFCAFTVITFKHTKELGSKLSTARLTVYESNI